MYEYREYSRSATDDEAEEMRLRHVNLLDEIDDVEEEKKNVAKGYKEQLTELRERAKALRKNVRFRIVETGDEVRAEPDYTANVMRYFRKDNTEVDELARTLTQAESQLVV